MNRSIRSDATTSFLLRVHVEGNETPDLSDRPRRLCEAPGWPRPPRSGYVAVMAPQRWLLLRGLSREKRQWGSFPEQLRAAGALRVERLDLPGVGSARDREAPWTVDAMVEDLELRFLEATAGEPGPWGILGVSLGGMVALAWTHRTPERFSSAVIVNSSAGDLARPTQRLRLPNVPTLIRAAWASPVQRELLVLGMNTSAHGGNVALAEEWAAYRQEYPVGNGVIARQMVAGLRFRSPPELGTSTLFVSGACDRFVDPLCTKRLALRYGAPHVEHPTAGHDLPLDDPDWLLRQMGRMS